MIKQKSYLFRHGPHDRQSRWFYSFSITVIFFYISYLFLELRGRLEGMVYTLGEPFEDILEIYQI